MFSSKNKKTEKEEKINEKDISDQIERDLIVHNMPNQEKILGTVSNPLAAGKVSLQGHVAEKKKFKIVGVLIMFFGFIVIAAIVYFAYIYTIAPAANKNKIEIKPENEIKKSEEELQASSTEPAPVLDLNNNNDTVLIEAVEVSGSEVDEADDAPLLDSDGDGLYDEEEIILGTSKDNQDSDGDGYNDLQEILNSYNPAGVGRIEDNSNLVFYHNQAYSFNFLYPVAWLTNQLNDNTFVLEAADSSYFQVSVMKNDNKSGIVSWYENMFKDESVSLDRLIVKSDFEAIKSADGLNFYITEESRENIYALSYIPINSERRAYKNIFNLMLNSFTFKK